MHPTSDHSTTRRLFAHASSITATALGTIGRLAAGASGEGGLRLQGLRKRSDDKLPVVSIVTVVYNGVDELTSTIESVLSLEYDNIEYIIVDGNSKDGTLELIRSYESVIDYWRSEPDSGIYDAMNKGVEFATGDFVYHLNIGDRILEIPIDALVQLPSDAACLACAVRLDGGQVFAPSGGISLRYHNTIHHQGCFYRRGSQIRYSTQYKVFSDFDLNQRLKKSGQIIATSSVIVAEHDRGGASHQRSKFGEVFKIIRSNYGLFWVVVCFLYFKFSGIRARLGLR